MAATRRGLARPLWTGRGLSLLLIAGALALLGHMLGPHTETHVTDSASALPRASACAAASDHEQPNGQVAHGAEQSCSGANVSPAHGDGGHGTTCGYLYSADTDDELAAPPARCPDVVPPAPSPRVLAVFGHPAGKRDPPDLVRELQVIRV